MKPYLNRCWLLPACSLLFVAAGNAQNISGYVMDENNTPVPYANVFVQELKTGASTDDRGYYFFTIDPGYYHVVVSSVGYTPQRFEVSITDKPVVKNIRLQASSTELNEIVVRTRRRDPAFEIIQKVIENKKNHLAQAQSARTQVYVRAMENVERKKEKEKNGDKPNYDADARNPLDPLEEARKKEEARLQQINLVEMQLTLNFRNPNQYKEERTAYRAYGRADGLFIPVFSQADFNFYHNLVDMKGLSEIPVISPVSTSAILSYKYKLEEVLKETSGVVFKIRVTPRKTGDATVSGHLFVNDSTWNINRLELTLEKGGLRFYDVFNINQTYEELQKDFWIPTRQEFTYQTKEGGRTFKGNTVLVFSNYERNYVFPENFFGDEVSVITKEAYERDTSFWNNARPEPLTGDQKKVIEYRDSVETVIKSKKYQDSLQAKFNKVTFGEVIYHGVGFQNHERRSYVNISSLLNLIDYSVVGGFRIGPYAWYFRRYENDRVLSLAVALKYGPQTRDVTGNVNAWWRYNPYRLGDLGGQVGRTYYSINSFDAYLNQLKLSNYILHEHVDAFHQIELVNGLYLRTEMGLHNRQPITYADPTSVIDKVIEQGDPLQFEDYMAFFTTTKLSFTPRQRYMTEPTRKVVLGSKYPTLIVSHRKGWNKVFSSDIDFDYVDFSVEQNLLLGTLGNSRYNSTLGTFANKRDLRYVDLKRFRQSDPYLYSDPLHSFQLLDTALNTTRLFFEAHYIHHFNGAMINNIPLVKKTKLRTVAGAGMMWIQESNYRHQEIFGGLERIFKLGPRRRLRIGVYGVVAQSNYRPPKTDYKISFDLIDTWKRDWSF